MSPTVLSPVLGAAPLASLMLMASLALVAPAWAEEATADAEPAPSAEGFAQARGVRAMGMGEAFRSIAQSTAGLYQNPAGVARGTMYALEGSFGYAPGGALLNAGVVDSQSNPSLAAGVGYTYFIGRDAGKGLTGHDFHGAVGLPVVPDRVSIGVGPRYVMLERDGKEVAKGFTLDAGVLFRIVDEVHMGLAAQNLIDICGDDARCGQVAPLNVAGGLSWGSDATFLVAADVAMELVPEGDPLPTFSVGAEYFLQKAIPLRAGWIHRPEEGTHLVTGGFGWRSGSAGVDLGYQHDLRQPGKFGNIAGAFSLYLR